MRDLLAKASAWLEGKRGEFLVREITYRRGPHSVTLPATIGRTVFQISREFGLFQRTVSRDYLVSVTDLVLDGQRTLPQAGDRIEEVDGDTTYVHEVRGPAREPCWRWCDGYRMALRIHTKLIDEEEA